MYSIMWQKQREYLQYIGNEFERVCDRMRLKISIGKSKVLMLGGERNRWSLFSVSDVK